MTSESWGFQQPATGILVWYISLIYNFLEPCCRICIANHAIPSTATARMPPPQGRSGPTRDSGPRSPKSILVAQYSLLLSIGTGTAGVTYFTIAGPEDTVNLVGNAVNIATVIALKLCSYIWYRLTECMIAGVVHGLPHNPSNHIAEILSRWHIYGAIPHK